MAGYRPGDEAVTIWYVMTILTNFGAATLLSLQATYSPRLSRRERGLAWVIAAACGASALGELWLLVYAPAALG